MTPLKLFVSHTSQYGNLAKSLRMSLLALQPNEALDIKIHEDMPGGTDWRKWIEESTRAAHGFVLLYPHDDMDMGWPNFEVARFFGREDERENKVVWIRNPDLKKWPAVFEPYQAYDATPAGIFKFFKETFVDGLFTDGQALNAEIGVISNGYYQIARTAARELADQFADATIRPQFHTRRIQISLAYDKDQKLDPERTRIEGNADGMKMIGMNADAEVNWSAVRAHLDDSVEWPTELESEIAAFAAGALPPCLSPFPLESEIYLPVVTKSETLQSLLRRITLIFVEADAGKLRSMLEWKMPDTMPSQIAAFVRLVRLMLRVRYDILEPRYQEAIFRSPSSERRLEICHGVLAEYDAVRAESEKAGLRGVEAFYMIFDAALRPKLDAASIEYVEGLKALKRYAASLKTKPPTEVDDDDELGAILQRLRENNAHWLEVAAKQFEVFVNMWQ